VRLKAYREAPRPFLGVDVDTLEVLGGNASPYGFPGAICRKVLETRPPQNNEARTPYLLPQTMSAFGMVSPLPTDSVAKSTAARECLDAQEVLVLHFL